MNLPLRGYRYLALALGCAVLLILVGRYSNWNTNASSIGVQVPITAEGTAFSFSIKPDGRFALTDNKGNPVDLEQLEPQELPIKVNGELQFFTNLSFFLIEGSHRIVIRVGNDVYCLLFDDDWTFKGRCEF